MARVAVVFTGGTISMRSDAGSSGNRPTLRGEELLASVPGLEEVAEIEPIDWGLVPASHLTLAQVLEIGRILDAQLRRPEIDGAVVVQGTDVIEETAFAWDLLPLPTKPVVVVGAMRSASEDGYDGPENLRNAVAAAADPSLGGLGVVVALAGELHGADDVRKTHTHAYATFQSPNAGRLGTVADGRVMLSRGRTPVRLPRVPERAALPVPLLTAVLDGSAASVAAALAEAPAGLVVAATGGGNTPPEILEAARSLIGDGIPVVLTTRCPSGRPMPGYGFPGGSSEWWAARAIFSGALGGPKSRILLALGLGAGLDADGIGRLCQAFGGGREGVSAGAGPSVTAPATNRSGEHAALDQVIRALIVLATAERGMATSREIAAAIGTHEVVVRRMLGQVRDSGLVESRSGPHGGWAIARDPARVRLSHIKAAVAGRAAPKVARSALADALAAAAAAADASLEGITLADLIRNEARYE
jgi:L-asparaginase